jgi:hypothetical protein
MRLTITADCGGSNGPQVKLWKRELQLDGHCWSPKRHELRELVEDALEI